MEHQRHFDLVNLVFLVAKSECYYSRFAAVYFLRESVHRCGGWLQIHRMRLFPSQKALSIIPRDATLSYILCFYMLQQLADQMTRIRRIEHGVC